MSMNFSIPVNSIKGGYQYMHDLAGDGKLFPLLTIDRDSYIADATCDIDFLDRHPIVYNFQIGKYCSLADKITLIIDRNHDYRCVCQGRISGIPIEPPKAIRRKGQIIIMNDCWIGEHAIILSGVTIGNGAIVSAGALVTKDVPPYAIVAGNPARIIGYRFTKEQIDSLNVIRWWNWPVEKINNNLTLLSGDVDTFINTHLDSATNNINAINPVKINKIPKGNSGDESVFLYIPDFEQDYPTYPHVIESFIKSYSDTNCELLLYIKQDDFLDDKLYVLNNIFEKYEDYNCYINLHIDDIADERSLFCQVNAYITNRSTDNVSRMDMAQFYNLPIISGVDIPMFDRNHEIGHMISEH